MLAYTENINRNIPPCEGELVGTVDNNFFVDAAACGAEDSGDCLAEWT